MSFEYIDEDTDKLWVDKSRPGSIFIGAIRASREPEDCASVRVPAEDAPAIALAILEAAGNVDINSLEATNRLREFVNLQNAQAEREAEDAKVREFFSTMWPIAYHNTGRVTDMMRTEYNAARKFFEEA